jgi:hypothetical protein
MMVFAYLLGRTDPEGRTVIESWAATRSRSQLGSAALSVLGLVVIANLIYGAVFAPHLAAKLDGQVTAGPTARLFPGVPNQPLHGSATSDGSIERADSHQAGRSARYDALELDMDRGTRGWTAVDCP